MRKMTEDIKEILRANICYFATSSKNNMPNVVPVGLVEPISDSQVLIIDVHFNKTRKNLEENPEVALAVTDIKRLQAYQLKGKAEIITSGELFDKTYQVMEEKSEKPREIIEKEIQDPELIKKYQQRMEKQKSLKPKAAILISITEIYSTMSKK